ncbi:reverse transcriptase domain-containing protein [Tanacetum coccineum]
MSMQSSSNQIGLHLPNPEKSLRFCPKEVSNPINLFMIICTDEDENVEDVQMADHLRPMEELLRVPIVGIEDAIVVPAVLANEFELKIELLDFISNNPFFGLENDDPHSHIIRFYQITRTLKLNQVPHDVVKLILFPFSLKGAAETWLENEPPNSITTWDDLVSKFLNRFYPHSKTRKIRNEITTFNKFSMRLLPKLGKDSRKRNKNRRTYWKCVEYPSSQSTPLVPPPETPPLSVPKLKENPEPNPHQPPIPYPSWLQKDKFQALENPTGRANHFVYRTDIVDSLCDKFPIQNDQSSGSTTSHFDHSLLDYESFYFDVVLKEFEDLLYHGHLIDLPDIDNGIYDSEGDILFLEKLLEDEPSEAKKSKINPLIREPSDAFLIGNKEIEFSPLKDIDDPVLIPRVSEQPLDSLDPILKTFDMTITNPLFDFDSEFTLNSDNPIFDTQNKESDEFETETIMDEVSVFARRIPYDREDLPCCFPILHTRYSDHLHVHI